MKAKESKLDDLLSNVDTKFTVPIFQRKYSWDEEQCHTLWKDLQKLGETSLNSGHFIGSIVCYQLNDIDMPGVNINRWTTKTNDSFYIDDCIV